MPCVCLSNVISLEIRNFVSVSHLTGRPVRPAVEEDDAVRVFATQNGHDWPRPDFDALLLKKKQNI